jgi:orotate phosphoribosyltransferase
MEQYKIDFIHLLVRAKALKFGEFTLKSGRKAPFFLNMGSFYTGELMTALSSYYAKALISTGIEADVIFGPAYKGIPLAVGTCMALKSEHDKNYSYAFSRKKIKEYAQGMGKYFVGAPFNSESRVLLIDDVITAGTAIRETLAVLSENGDPIITGVLIALNRMEKNNDGENALEILEQEMGAPVVSIVDLNDVIEVLYNKEVDGVVHIDDAQLEIITAYRKEYGVA